jgi:hypothetical protein
MDQFDREIVEFVAAWAPYGGPPEDEVLPRFGMSADRLRNRLRQIVVEARNTTLTSDDRRLVLQAAEVAARQRRVESTRHAATDGDLVHDPLGATVDDDYSAESLEHRPRLQRGVWRWR